MVAVDRAVVTPGAAAAVTLVIWYGGRGMVAGAGIPPPRLERNWAGSGVTGVQTCALPIYGGGRPGGGHPGRRGRSDPRDLVRGAWHGGRRRDPPATPRAELGRVGSDWSSDVCSSDLWWRSTGRWSPRAPRPQ